MKYKMTLSALLIGALSVGAFATTSALKNQPARTTGQEDRQKEKEEHQAESSKKLAKQAKITMEQAREIALKRAPGNLEQGELEREHGKLVYSFDIHNAKGTISEVQVDAKNGRVVSVEEEVAQKEAEEMREEEQKRTRHKRP